MSKRMAEINRYGAVVNVITCDDSEPDTDTLITYTADNPAFIGGDYLDGYFYPPQPYPSWTRSLGQWVAPVPEPADGRCNVWDEDTQSWHPMGL